MYTVGEFGIVYKGYIVKKQGSIVTDTVAIKTLKGINLNGILYTSLGFKLQAFHCCDFSCCRIVRQKYSERYAKGVRQNVQLQPLQYPHSEGCLS